MPDKSYKNIFDDGVTTYHDDGSKSVTYKNIFDDGVTTYHEDGSKSKTYKNVFDDGVTTYHEDGSKSKTYKNVFDDGVTTYHKDGSKSKTYKNVFDSGYTTYHHPNRNANHSPTGTGYSDSVSGFGAAASPKIWYSPDIIRRQEINHVLNEKHNKYAAIAYFFMFVPTVYVVATFFIKFLPTSFLLMFTLLFAAEFIFSFFACAARQMMVGTTFLFVWVYSFIYILQLVFQIVICNDIFGHSAQLYIIWFGPIAFASAWLVGIICGKIFGLIVEKRVEKSFKGN